MLRNIPSATLKQLVKLSARKEALLAQLQAIDREMIRLEQKHGVPVRRAPLTRVTVSGTAGKPKRKRAKRS